MEQSFHSLNDDNQEKFLGYSIIDHPIDSPSKSIFESSHFNKSCDMLSPLPLCNERSVLC